MLIIEKSQLLRINRVCITETTANRNINPNILPASGNLAPQAPTFSLQEKGTHQGNPYAS